MFKEGMVSPYLALSDWQPHHIPFPQPTKNFLFLLSFSLFCQCSYIYCVYSVVSSYLGKAAAKCFHVLSPASQTTNLLLKSVKINVFSSSTYRASNQFITMQHMEFRALQLRENRAIKCDAPQRSRHKLVVSQKKAFSNLAHFSS